MHRALDRRAATLNGHHSDLIVRIVFVHRTTRGIDTKSDYTTKQQIAGRHRLSV